VRIVAQRLDRFLIITGRDKTFGQLGDSS